MQYSVSNPVGGYLHKPFERNALLTPRRQCEAMVTAPFFVQNPPNQRVVMLGCSKIVEAIFELRNFLDETGGLPETLRSFFWKSSILDSEKKFCGTAHQFWKPPKRLL